MYEKKVKTGLSLTPGCIRQIDDSLSLCGCSSRNELVEKAVRFYISYTTTENNPTILERTITNATYAALQKTEDRLARILFKLAVEHAKLLKVFAEFADLGDLDLRQTQREAYEEVMKSQGIITLDKAVKEKQW